LTDYPSFYHGRSRFRWVALQLDAVSKCYTMNSLRATLSSLPSTLGETYTRILDGIDESHRPQVYRILQCVCFSMRPLRVEELAILFQPGDQNQQPQFHLDDALFFPEHVLDLCSSLLIMSMTKPWTLGPYYCDHDVYETVIYCVVQLSHFSVKEYLISPRASFWHLDEDQSHLAILRMVTTYYILVASMSDFCSLSLEDLIIKHSLAIYAAIHTRGHAYHLGEHPDLLESFRTLLNPDSAFLCNPIGSRYFNAPAFRVYPRAYAPAISLYVAADLGLSQTLEWLLTFDICRDALLSPPVGPLWECELPLLVAVHRSHLDTIKVLLGVGAGTYESIDRAVDIITDLNYGEDLKVLETLIEAAGDLNVTLPGGCPTGRNDLLRRVAENGWADTVSMLISRGMDVNGGDSQHWGSPIQAAAENGHWGIVKKLLDAGADVDLPGACNSGTELYNAACTGKKDMVQILIDAGANVDITGGTYGSAIQAASYQGHQDVVALLIQSGANINVRGIVYRYVEYKDGGFVEDDLGNFLVLLRYQSALSIAREKRFDGIVKQLEDAGAVDFCDVADEVGLDVPTIVT
jgi:ankyrin repeat protein